jgi:hypothetical protein
MAHELAHCEHGPHNDKFFRLMDDILEQHAVLMAAGLSRDGGYTMPAFAGSGQLLGSSGGGRPGLLPPSTRPMAGPPTAEQVRNARLRHLQNNKGAPGGRKLGGDGVFSQWMSPAEAAVAAAEARRRMQQLRLRGDRCCRPVAIEVDGDGDDDEGAGDGAGRPASDGDDDRKPAAAAPAGSLPLNGGGGNGANPGIRGRPPPNDGAGKRPRGGGAPAKAPPGEENRRPPPPPSSRASRPPPRDGAERAPSEVIDLTGDDYDHGGVGEGTIAGSGRAPAPPYSPGPWACRRCTYLNQGAAAAPHGNPQACAVCETPRFDPPPRDSDNNNNTTTRALRLRVYK